MTFSVHMTSNYGITHIIGAIIGCCIIAIFTIGVAYDFFLKIYKRFIKGVNASNNSSIDTRLMIYIDLLIILVHMIMGTFIFVFSSDDSDCTFITKSSVCLFHITRCLMYTILVRRIHNIYNNTIFHLNKLHLCVLYVIISIYSLPYIVYINWYLIETKFDQQFGCLIQYQSSTSSTLILVIMSILNIFIAIYCLYLFIYPLYRLVKNQEDKEVCYKLYNVMIKHSILYSCSIVSSIILFVMSYTYSFGYNYSIIHSLIDGIILILLHPMHNKIYKTICCILHPFCMLICEAATKKEHDDDEPVPSTVLETATKSNAIHINTKPRETSKRDRSESEELELSQINSPKIPVPQSSRPEIIVHKLNTTHIADILKEKYYDTDSELENMISINIGTPSPPPPSICNASSYIQPYDDIDCIDMIIMEDIETNANPNDLALEAFKSSLSSKSVKSKLSDKAIENTLKFIDYESTRL